ncbi:MAG: hypothetical protein M3Q58_03655 [Bacteroidota bacterium]|nr:hypothetical protein [Bacteroidota bacterium]
MSIQVFKESEVRAAILKKAPYEEKSGKRSPHKTCWITYKDVKIDHMRIPNNHKKEFWQNKGKEVARKLRLSESQYNEFVKCNLSREEYESILNDYLIDQNLIPSE